MKNRIKGVLRDLPLLGLGLALAVPVAALILFSAWQLEKTTPTAQADKDCTQIAAEFEDYALVSAGPEFEGLPLTDCYRKVTAEQYHLDGVTVRQPATDFFVFIYGDCVIPEGEEGCPPPLQVIVDPPCAFTPLEDFLKVGKEKVRDKDVDIKNDGSVRIETDGWKVTVFALESDFEKSKEKAIRVAKTLKGANPTAEELSVDKGFDTKVKESKKCR